MDLSVDIKTKTKVRNSMVSFITIPGLLNIPLLVSAILFKLYALCLKEDN